MSRPSREEKIAIAERRLHVSRRYSRGESQSEIARAFEVTQQTISNDLQAIQAEWRRESVLITEERKAKEVAKIDELERQAWQGWARSQEAAETTTEETQGEGEDARMKTQRTVKVQAGNPSFLEMAHKCIRQRLEISGLLKDGKEKETGATILQIIEEEVPAGERVKAAHANPDQAAPDSTLSGTTPLPPG